MFFIYLLKRYQLKKILDFWHGDNKIKENIDLSFNVANSILFLVCFCTSYFIGTFVYQNSLDVINKEIQVQQTEEIIMKKTNEIILLLKRDAINVIKEDINKKIDEVIKENENK